mmetsp:Transcript_82830/g.237955  ORF Transcript_82830/g.237955 Transcript_82830/m.237955 type:complete len:372 (-) Transcript_82830:497-1612(-)
MWWILPHGRCCLLLQLRQQQLRCLRRRGYGGHADEPVAPQGRGRVLQGEAILMHCPNDDTSVRPQRVCGICERHSVLLDRRQHDLGVGAQALRAELQAKAASPDGLQGEGAVAAQGVRSVLQRQASFRVRDRNQHHLAIAPQRLGRPRELQTLAPDGRQDLAAAEAAPADLERRGLQKPHQVLGVVLAIHAEQIVGLVLLRARPVDPIHQVAHRRRGALAWQNLPCAPAGGDAARLPSGPVVGCESLHELLLPEHGLKRVVVLFGAQHEPTTDLQEHEGMVKHPISRLCIHHLRAALHVGIYPSALAPTEHVRQSVRSSTDVTHGAGDRQGVVCIDAFDVSAFRLELLLRNLVNRRAQDVVRPVRHVHMPL